MAPEIAKLGHVAMTTPDLEATVWFYTEMVGLHEVAREDDTVFLRAASDWEHHSLQVREGEESALDHIGWRTRKPGDVQQFAERLERTGTDVRWCETGTERGVGEAVRFSTPQGHPMELYYEVEKPDPPAEKRSKLKNRVHRFEGGIYPHRIDHVNVWDVDVDGATDWLMENLGFELIEYLEQEDGSKAGAWLSSNAVNHDIAVQFDPGGKSNRFHHTAFYVPETQDIIRAADLLREHDVPIDFNSPGKHGLSRANYMYFRDPASNQRVELYTGGYIVQEPDWEPIRWGPEESETVLSWYGPTEDVITASSSFAETIPGFPIE